MIKDLVRIYNLISELMLLGHPIIQDIRYLFCQRLNGKCWDSREQWEGIVRDWHYSLNGFVKLVLRDKSFRQNIIKVLSLEKVSCEQEKEIMEYLNED